MKDKLYQITLPDYATPSFISDIKYYFGTQEELTNLRNALIQAGRQDELWADVSDAIRVLGHGTVDRELLVPMDMIHEKEIEVTDGAWEYLNIWDCPYHLRAKKAVFQVAWVGNSRRWFRLIRGRFLNLEHQVFFPEGYRWMSMNNFAFWGFPCMIEQEGNLTYSRLWVVDRPFGSLDELEQDCLSHDSQEMDLDGVFEDVYGGG